MTLLFHAVLRFPFHTAKLYSLMETNASKIFYAMGNKGAIASRGIASSIRNDAGVLENHVVLRNASTAWETRVFTSFQLQSDNIRGIGSA